ncbi:MAG TPA: serine/threonine-protein kinase [Kofleriaceae bacterium]|nr:serine/threonine-protein kinase [Kofleriaceae bacterium]
MAQGDPPGEVETRSLSDETEDLPARGAALPFSHGHVRDRDRYVLLGEHGRGGLGKVTRAHDRELGRDVAIKELIAPERGGEARFLREALVTARLEHPGIVAVHEAGRWPDGTPFYAMKLVSGRPLRDLINERPTADERIGLLHHVIAVADAIAYAHGRKIIHRDLKPSNIIVGDFGETVVIDWGLAKDLHDEPSSQHDGDRRLASPSSASELTGEGSGMGTPAYMAPEQAQGEPVDQRADVYAIGAMLWELCALERKPFATALERKRALVDAGIDRDLIAIINKALAPEPAGRYPDAGALATDLKAFKAGARIAARRYTLLAILAHWIRHHRALALTIAIAVVLAAVGGAVSVHNLAAARDRAEESNDQRVLEHAELLLRSDPTAAVAALAAYHGSDELRRRRLIAEAHGRGVASAVHAPHNDTVWFLYGDEHGGIISLSEDRRIQLTQGAITTTLATDVSSSVRVAYAPTRKLVAYVTSPPGIAVLDLATHKTHKIGDGDPQQLVFAPDGSRLAALDASDDLVVWQVPAIAGAPATAMYRGALPGAVHLAFVSPSRLIVQAPDALHAIVLGDDGGAADVRALPGLTSLDAGRDLVIAGGSDGKLTLLTPALAIRGQAQPCRKNIASVQLIPDSDQLAYACGERVAGVARFDRATGELAILDTFNTVSTPILAVAPTGRYLVVLEESSTASIYDTHTRLLTQYAGSAGQPSIVTPPTAAFPQVLIGDVNGTVRVWDPPTSAARVVAQTTGPIFGLAVTPDGTAAIADGVDGIVRRVPLAGDTVRELRGHGALVAGVRAAPDGASILSYSFDGSVRTWRTTDWTAMRTFTAHAGLVANAEYVEGGRRIVSVGDDGRLLAWSPEGDDLEVLFRHGAPLTGVEVIPQSDRVVVKDARGGLWQVALHGEARMVRAPDGADIRRMRAAASGAYFAIGTDTGAVTVYDTATWRPIRELELGSVIHQIAFDPHSRDVLIASEAGPSRTGRVRLVSLDARRTLPWHEITGEIRGIAYAPDGETIAMVSKDGGMWLYTVAGDAWSYAHDHDVEVSSVQFSIDGKHVISSDRRGVVILRDVDATTHPPRKR